MSKGETEPFRDFLKAFYLLCRRHATVGEFNFEGVPVRRVRQ